MKAMIKIIRPAIVKATAEDRQVLATVSTGQVDRDGDVVVQRGIDFTAYRKNPVVMAQHDFQNLPVGKALWIKFDPATNSTVALLRFAKTPQAEELYLLYKDGIMSAFSIGFTVKDSRPPTKSDPKKWQAANRIILKSELLEFSCVAIPANAGALAIEVKSRTQPIIKIKPQPVILRTLDDALRAKFEVQVLGRVID